MPRIELFTPCAEWIFNTSSDDTRITAYGSETDPGVASGNVPMGVWVDVAGGGDVNVGMGVNVADDSTMPGDVTVAMGGVGVGEEFPERGEQATSVVNSSPIAMTRVFIFFLSIRR